MTKGIYSEYTITDYANARFRRLVDAGSPLAIIRMELENAISSIADSMRLLHYGYTGFYLDVTRKELRVGGVTHVLSKYDVKIMEALCRKAGSVVPYTDLEISVWGRSDVDTHNELKTYLSRLRAKIGKDAILTFRNRGCMFTFEGARNMNMVTAINSME